MKGKGIFEVKYPVGSKVWYIEMVATPHYESCNSCEGDGNLYTLINKIKFMCPHCRGNGKLTTQGGLKEVAICDEVLRIEVDIESESIDIDYVLKEASEGFKNEAKLFLTKEEAEGTEHNGIMGYTNG
jgi:hypothetical protein